MVNSSRSSAEEMGNKVDELKAEEMERRVAPMAGGLNGNKDGDNVPVGQTKPRLI